MKPSLSLSSQSPTTLALASGLRLSSSVLRHRLPASLNPTRLSILRHNLSELRFLSSSSSRTRTHLRPIQALEKDGQDGNGSVLVKDTIENNERVVRVELHKEATEAYMAHAMSVLLGRALRDGLKPVHRRILYAMHELGLASRKLFKKCARVLGKFHPHGDTAVYDSLVRMAQLIEQEANELKRKFSSPRRSVLEDSDSGQLDDIDVIPNEEMLLAFSENGYVKRKKPNTFNLQHRGTIGKSVGKLRVNDAMFDFIVCRAHDHVLYFSDKGTVYSARAYKIPECTLTAAGSPLVQILSLSDGERITSVIPVNRNHSDSIGSPSFFCRVLQLAKAQLSLRRYRPLAFTCGLNLTPHSPAPAPAASTVSQTLLRLSVSAALFLGLGLLCWAASAQSLPHLPGEPGAVLEECTAQEEGDEGNSDNLEKLEDNKLEAKFGAWKSKTYALTVPLRISALRGSVPPSWVKDFMQSQGKRSKVHLKSHASLEGIFSDLSVASSKGNVGPSSVAAADLISVGDSWLTYAINKAIIEPIQGVEDQDWFKGLSDRWKVYLRRNCDGRIEPDGTIWAAPYRWGCMVIAYRKNKFRKHQLAPVEDWADLWRPELAGRISMVDSPREVIGAVLKYMGASYNTKDIHLQVDGGRDAVRQNLALLVKQVRLFDSSHYLKAFGVGDAWVAVGWSSDVLPVAKRMSDVAVIVPKSGASMWADLWAIPAVSRLETNRIGGRVRGPSPLIHQWIEFCLQAARALPFNQEVIPGASPSALDSSVPQVLKELIKGKPKLDTNLIAGVPPPQILARCEFLEPLPDSTLSDYQWLIASMQKSRDGFVANMHSYMSSLIQNFWLKLHSKPTPQS